MMTMMVMLSVMMMTMMTMMMMMMVMMMMMMMGMMMMMMMMATMMMRTSKSAIRGLENTTRGYYNIMMSGNEMPGDLQGVEKGGTEGVHDLGPYPKAGGDAR